MQLLVSFCLAPNGFCSSLFVQQKKHYRHLQGIQNTICCAFCTNLSIRPLTSALVSAAESRVNVHKWDEDMVEASDEANDVQSYN